MSSKKFLLIQIVIAALLAIALFVLFLKIIQGSLFAMLLGPVAGYILCVLLEAISDQLRYQKLKNNLHRNL